MLSQGLPSSLASFLAVTQTIRQYILSLFLLSGMQVGAGEKRGTTSLTRLPCCYHRRFTKRYGSLDGAPEFFWGVFLVIVDEFHTSTSYDFEKLKAKPVKIHGLSGQLMYDCQAHEVQWRCWVFPQWQWLVSCDG